MNRLKSLSGVETVVSDDLMLEVVISSTIINIQLSVFLTVYSKTLLIVLSLLESFLFTLEGCLYRVRNKKNDNFC